MKEKQKKKTLKHILFKKKNITIDEALQNRERNKKNKHTTLIILIILSILIIIATNIYTGYITYHAGKGGYLYEINLLYKKPTFHWAGLYGASFGVGQTQDWEFNLGVGSMIEANMFFECLEKGKNNLLFASYVPEQQVLLNTLEPATPQEIDILIGIDNTYVDSATQTFTKTMNITLEGRQINNIPAIQTRVGKGTNQTAFKTGILIDQTGNYVYVTEIQQVLVRGFNERIYNYQFMLPLKNATTTKYHVFIDPYNVCLGEDEDLNETGTVHGIVTDLIGKPINEVLIVIEEEVTITNSQGEYNLTVSTGPKYLFAIKEGYKIHSGNTTIIQNKDIEHNIILEIQLPTVEYTDFGPDQGPDQGPGEIPHEIERPAEIEGQDYWIPVNRITKRIREGEFAQETIFIQSFKQTSMQVNIEITGDVAKIISQDKESLLIPARGDGRLTLTFFGNETPGIYNGTANITGAINAQIPIEVEILDRDRIPIQALLLGLTMADKKIYAGTEINFRTDLTNLLTDKEYPVKLFYSIQNLDGTETIWTHSANVFIKTSLSILRRVELPTNLTEGDYVIRVTANYLELSSSTSHVFRISLPFYQSTLFWKIKVWHAILGFLFLTGIIIATIIIKKKRKEKKKYHLKVEYEELPKPGPRNIFIGKIAETERKSYMNLENFKTHTIVAGTTGGGKSFSAQVIIEEMLLKDIAVIVFDPTAQWTGMLRKLTNKGLISLYPSFGMKEKDAQPFKGNIRQINNARELIDIKKYIKPGEIQIFAVHKLDPKEIDIFVANTVREVFRANFNESEPLRICLVYDEVHRLLPKFGGSGEGFLQIERACREFRKWGIGVLLISQVLADFVGQIKANINTEIQMRTRDEEDLERIKTKYGIEVLQSLVKASIGTGMVQNSAYNRGRPYFTTFRPIMHSVTRLGDEEIEQYNEYNKKIDQITYELEQLEEEKIDVFDLKLELKLALDKVKSGNFNMVKIYIEGLEPRIKKQWIKLEKTPKNIQQKLVSLKDMEEEIKKAQRERKKFEEENKLEEKKDEKTETPRERFKKDVPPNKILKLHNEMLVVTPTNLFSEIEAMKNSDFEYHVNEDKNDFADWIRNAVGDEELAEHLDNTKDRKEIMSLLDKRAKGTTLPKLEKKPEKKKEEEIRKVLDEFEKDPKIDTKKQERKTNEEETYEEENSDWKKQEKKENKKEKEQRNEKIIKKIFEKVSPQDKTFKLENGSELHSIKEFFEKINNIPDEVFYKHVTNKKNDFAEWIEHVFEEKELANKIRKKYNKKEIKKVFEE